MTKKENVIQDKSYEFALQIVKLFKYLQEEKKEFILSKQLLRCGTSIGANIEEAIGGQSKKDFIAKMSIAYKETRETNYWLRILKDTEYILEKEFEPFIKDLDEIQKILISSLKTAKNNL